MKDKTNEELIKTLIKIFDLEKKTKEDLQRLEECKDKIMNELWNRIPVIGGRTK